MRLESTIKNSFWGIVYHFIYILLGFISRVVFVRILGEAYYGLNGYFTSLISLLSVADLGIGWAISYNLYKPLAEKNEQEIAKLMNFFKRVYTGLCILILFIGILTLPFLGNIVKADFPINRLQIIFGLFILENAIGYLFAYSSVLLIADQKNYVFTIYEMIISVVQISVRMIFLIVTGSYVVYLLSGIAIKVFGNYLRSQYVNKRYPYIKDSKVQKLDTLTKEKIFRDAKDIVINRICTTLATASDNIFIMFFSGVNTVGYFSNYTLIFNITNGFAGQFLNSYQASLGNFYTTENDERKYLVFKRSFFFSYLVLALSLPGLFLLSDQLIVLWMGSGFVLSGIGIKIAIVNLVLTMYFEPLGKVVNAAGIFYVDKYFALVDIVLKLVFALLLGKLYGLPGIFFATTIGLIFSIILRSYYVITRFFKQSYLGFLKQTMMHIAMAVIQLLLVQRIIKFMAFKESFISFVAQVMVVIVCFVVINILVWRKTDEFDYMKLVYERVISIIKKNKESKNDSSK